MGASGAMRDLFFIAFLGLCFLLAFRRPFIFTLVYVYIDVVAPQRLSYFLLNSIPVSAIAFALMILGLALDPAKRDIRPTWRQGAIALLLAWCAYMTTQAVEPLWAADKWVWVWKALLFALVLPFYLHKRLRIEAIILTYVLCASAIIVTGGLKTIASGGGGYGQLVLLVNQDTGLYESSIISLVAIGIIPLILWLANHGTIFKPDWRVKLYAAALIFSCLLIPIGTEARTGLVCIAVLAVLMLRFSKRRFLYLGIAATVGLLTVPFLPQSFTKRMETITNPGADESAATRLAVWQWTWEFVLENPQGGGFDSYRINKIRYNLENSDGSTVEGRSQVVDEARAFHSSYFEMLGEHGFFGLFLWLFIFVGTVFRLEIMQRRYRTRAPPGDEWIAPLALALQNFIIIFLVGSLFVGIAFQPVPFALCAVAIAFDSYVARRRREAEFRPLVGGSIGRQPAGNV